MPPRSTHKKSRNGCIQCKRRRVKCDEQGPPCSNCRTRELDCSYTKNPKPRSDPGVSSPSTPSIQLPLPQLQQSQQRHVNPTNEESHSIRLRDLGLMHKFSTSTYQSLCNDPSDQHAWQIIIPEKALEYDFLLNGVLAVAALHCATTAETSKSLKYVDTALQYHNMAFAPFQEALNNLTPVNCEAVFAYSIITTVISIALPQLTPEKEKTSSMTENIILLFELLQGVKGILKISQPWLKAKLFTPRHDVLASPILHLDTETSTVFDRLVSLNETLATFDPDQHRINNEAISLLRNCFSRYARSREAASVLTWISAVGKDFVQYLRRRQPFQLLILMHWGVLLGELDGELWWAKDSGKALVAELLADLPPAVFLWDGAQLWPKQRLGL